MARKIVGVSILLFVSWAWFGLSLKEIRAEEEAKDIPKVTEFFAAKQITPGNPWKIYLNASFPGRKMKRIVVTVEQPGIQAGTYPVSFTRIKEESQQEFSGYISLLIPIQGLNHQTIKLTLQIQYSPKGGGTAYSKPIEFPLAIDDTCMYNNTCIDETPPGGVFKDNYLGPVMIQLLPPAISPA